MNSRLEKTLRIGPKGLIIFIVMLITNAGFASLWKPKGAESNLSKPLALIVG